MQLQSANTFYSLLLTDAQLLTIKSKEENDFVLKYMSDQPSITSYVWLGLNFNSQGKTPSFETEATS